MLSFPALPSHDHESTDWPDRDSASLVEIIVPGDDGGDRAMASLSSICRAGPDAAAQQVARCSDCAADILTRQFDVIVSVRHDDVRPVHRGRQQQRRHHSDERMKFWRPTGSGNRFAVPPRVERHRDESVVGTAIRSAVCRASFHRDGFHELRAVKCMWKAATRAQDYRAITVTRARGVRNSGVSPAQEPVQHSWSFDEVQRATLVEVIVAMMLPCRRRARPRWVQREVRAGVEPAHSRGARE